MANTHTTLSSLFSDIASAIREKTGSTDNIVADNFPTVIRSMSSGEYEHIEPQIITSSTTFIVPSTGKYRIAAIGKGAKGYTSTDLNTNNNGTACGGGGYLEVELQKNAIYSITITDSQSSFGDLIVATCGRQGSGTGLSGTQPKSGTVSGDGVIGFESNDTICQADIIPPSFWSRFLSSGGYTYDQNTGADYAVEWIASGGKGLFGGKGADSIFRYSTGAHVKNVQCNTVIGAGAGAAGTPTSLTANSAGTSAYGGGGGGGGYGGAGGAPRGWGQGSSYYGTPGEGGAGCVYIEKIGTSNLPDLIIPKVSASSIPVGSTVTLPVDGEMTEFIVVNQGAPNTTQYTNANGTWLLAKYVLDSPVKWCNGVTLDYTKSDAYKYLNNTYYTMLDSRIQSAIKTVKLPYFMDYLVSGSSGAECKAFLLSTREINSGFMTESGSPLNYFSSDNNNLRKAYTKSATAVNWWLRDTTEYYDSDEDWDYEEIYYVSSSGSVSYEYESYLSGGARYRPCFVIDSSFEFSDLNGTYMLN